MGDTFLSQPGSTPVYIYFTIIILLIGLNAVFITALYGSDQIKDQDVLNVTFYENVPIIGDFGGWSLSHFIAFFIAGLLFPEMWVLIFILGISWEFFEIVLGMTVEKFLGTSPATKSNRMYDQRWITGNISDIWMNAAGLFLGYWIGMFIRELMQY